MSTLKRFGKYILWIIGVYLLTNLLIFIGFNSNYKNIELREEAPSQITIDKAEATKDQGRVYGKVKNSSENNLNGKYIKITVYNSNNENIATEYLKIENLDNDMEKAFRSTFNANDAKSYEINIVDNN